MKTLDEAAFLTWADGAGLCLDPQYPESAVLVFRPDPQQDRFLEVPVEPERRPYVLLCFLELRGGWQECYAWRHLGSWPEFAEPLRINDVVEWQILKGLGLPLERNQVQADRDRPALAATVVARNILSPECADAFSGIWRSFRNDVHHMNPSVNNVPFRDLAKRNLKDLATIEPEILAVSFDNEKLVPIQPLYSDLEPAAQPGCFSESPGWVVDEARLGNEQDRGARCCAWAAPNVARALLDGPPQ